MVTDVLLGLQWGDEGKGKVIDVLTPNYEIVARFQGGPNAGHTLEFGGEKHVLHTIPSGIFRPDTLNIVGNGVVIDPVIMYKKEIQRLLTFKIDIKKKVLISKKAHLILPTHRLLDRASEEAKGKEKIGSTQKGIAPAYMDKTGRNGLRIGDILASDFKEKYNHLKEKHERLLSTYDFQYNLKEMEAEWFESIEYIKGMQIIDSEHFINDALKSGKKILAEGAQGTMLDIDFGTYPFVTSSSTITAGACTGLGIAPNKIGEVFGITKAYCTRVGSGPFPTELFDEDGEKIRTTGNEFGATTGRPRRCGWIDLPALRYALMINGVTQLIMTKADILSEFEKIKVCTHYEIEGKLTDKFPFDIKSKKVNPVYEEIEGWHSDISNCTAAEELPQALKNYIRYLEKELETPIAIVSVGPDRKQTILMKERTLIG